MNRDNIRVTMIMPTFNKEFRLKVTLESVKRLELEETVEIIIINDGSTDNTWSLLEDFKEQTENNQYLCVNTVNSVNTGRSAARNIAINAAKGKLIIFSDDDLILDSKFVLKHLEMHKRYEKAVVHGRIYSLPYLKFFKDPMTGELLDGGFAVGLLRDKLLDISMFESNEIANYLMKNSRLSKFETDIECLFRDTSDNDSYVRWIGFTGGNVSVMKEDLFKVGRFDSNLGKEWGCEDIELGYRLYRNGLQFYYCSDAINYHMNHYRDDFLNLHNTAMDYFIEKHKDRYIYALKDYFNGKLLSLSEWKQSVMD
ncbi:MAG: glycosyltransferase family 2 protein [Clostridia bacterium]